MDMVTGWVQNAASGVINQGIAAAGSFAGDAVSGVGDMIGSSGRQVGEGIATVSGGWGGSVRSYGDGAIAATAADDPHSANLPKTVYPGKKPGSGTPGAKAGGVKPGAGADAMKGLPASVRSQGKELPSTAKKALPVPYAPPTKDKTFYDGGSAKTFPAKKDAGAPKTGPQANKASPNLGGQKVAIPSESKPNGGAAKAGSAAKTGAAAKPAGAAKGNELPKFRGAAKDSSPSKGPSKGPNLFGGAVGASSDAGNTSKAPSVIGGGGGPSKGQGYDFFGGGSKAPSVVDGPVGGAKGVASKPVNGAKNTGYNATANNQYPGKKTISPQSKPSGAAKGKTVAAGAKS